MINLKKKEDIVNYLAANSHSESDLCEICETDMCYFFVYPNIDSSLLQDNILGICIVKAQDGYFSINIEYIENGMEYFDMNSVTDLSDEDLTYYELKIEQFEKNFRNILRL